MSFQRKGAEAQRGIRRENSDIPDETGRGDWRRHYYRRSKNPWHEEVVGCGLRVGSLGDRFPFGVNHS